MLGISSMSRDDNHTVRSIDLRHFWIPERHRIRSTRQSTTDAGYVKSEESVMWICRLQFKNNSNALKQANIEMSDEEKVNLHNDHLNLLDTMLS